VASTLGVGEELIPYPNDAVLVDDGSRHNVTFLPQYNALDRRALFLTLIARGAIIGIGFAVAWMFVIRASSTGVLKEFPVLRNVMKHNVVM
jgi:hypothetical protein